MLPSKRKNFPLCSLLNDVTSLMMWDALNSGSSCAPSPPIAVFVIVVSIVCSVKQNELTGFHPTWIN